MLLQGHDSDLVLVLGWTPTEGEQGQRINVNIDFTRRLDHYVKLRIVVGRRAIATQVRELSDQSNGRWKLEGIVPPFVKQRAVSPMVPIAVQVVDQHDVVLQSVTFGKFTYWESQCVPGSPLGLAAGRKREHIKTEDIPLPAKRVPTLPPSARERSKRRFPHARERPERRSNLGSIRDRHDVDSSSIYGSKAILELLSPLGKLAHDWDEQEMRQGRRLVRFHKIRKGNQLKVTCSATTPEEYSGHGDPVISCIRRGDGVEGYCVTSVDIIFLLERLVGDSFQVEEKNRIRRNLEGLRPTTISKHKVGSERFFQRIMDFPEPKPRNIEKDVKVFDWDRLPEALDKIISKYVSSPSFSSGQYLEHLAQTIPYDDADDDIPEDSCPVLDSSNADESASSNGDADDNHDISTPATTDSGVPQPLYSMDPMYHNMCVDPKIFLPQSPPSNDVGSPSIDSTGWDMCIVKLEAPDETFSSFDIVHSQGPYHNYDGQHPFEPLEYPTLSEYQVEHTYPFVEPPVSIF
ncbi:hypothetical protein HWV62_22868 [Athelia sp. TMB]|nr:hypothetical protein HWV62_22868 [Athelia sp. TMB]